MLGHLKIVDFLGPRPELKIMGKTRYKSEIGGILSIITSLTIILLIGYFILQTFSRSKATIVIYNQELEDNPYFNITKYPFAFTIVHGLTGQGFSEEEERKTFNIQFVYFSIDEQNIFHPTLINKVRCNTSLLGEYGSLFTTPKLPYTYCIDPYDPNASKIKMFGIFGSAGIGGGIVFYVNQCVNGTIPGVICNSIEKINEALQEVYMAFNYLDYAIDNNNLNEPGQIFTNSYTQSLTNTLHKTLYIYFRQIYHDTDFGFVFQDHKINHYYRTESILETVNTLPKIPEFPGNFARISPLCSRYKDTYNRSYLKLQDLLANIGGVLKGVMILAALINNILVQKIYLMDLSSQLFDFEFKNEKVFKKSEFIVNSSTQVLTNNLTGHNNRSPNIPPR
jgi:hypothetical protein